MKEAAIAKVYAQSLLELGDEKKIKIADELTRLTEVINQNNSLENVLFLELFTAEEKKTVFLEVAKKLNLSPITVETVKFLVDEKRIGILPLIIKEVIVLDDDRRGFIKGSIEGTEPTIDKAFKDKIETYIKQKLGRETQLDYVQNDKLTAGYKVTVGDLQLDATLDNQLEQFKQSILSE